MPLRQGRVSLLLAEHQCPKCRRDMKIRFWRIRGAPRRIKSRLSFAFDAIEIRPPGVFRVELRGQIPHRYGQFRRPRFRFFILDHAAVQPAVQLLDLAVRDRQVYPVTVRAHFKLAVHQRIRGIRLQESLSNIAIPQFIPPAIRARIWKYENAPVIACKAEEQCFRRPKQAKLGGPLRIRILSAPVLIKSNCRSFLPRRLWRQSLAIGLVQQSHGNGRGSRLRILGRGGIHGAASVMQPGPATQQKGGRREQKRSKSQEFPIHGHYHNGCGLFLPPERAFLKNTGYRSSRLIAHQPTNAAGGASAAC